MQYKIKSLTLVLTICLFPISAFSQLENTANTKRKEAVQTLYAAIKDYVSGDLAKAREGFQLSMNQDPSYPLPKFNLAVIAGAEENWVEAIRWLEEFLKLDQTSELAERAKAELEVLRQVLEMDKTPEGKRRRKYEAAINSTTSLLEMGAIKEAIAQAAEATKIDPSGWQPYALTASALVKIEMFNDAKRFIEMAIQRATTETKAKLKHTLEQIDKESQYKTFSDTANELMKKRDYKGAAMQYKNAWQLFPKRVEPGLGSAIALWLANDKKAANEILLTLEKNPDPTVSKEVRIIREKLNANNTK